VVRGGRGGLVTGDARYAKRTDAKGEFALEFPGSLDQVPRDRPPSYAVVAHDPEGRWANAVGERFAPAPGAAKAVELRMTAGGRVRGRVTDPAGRPVARIEVEAVPDDDADRGYYNPRALTDADGRYDLGPVRPARYTVCPDTSFGANVAADARRQGRPLTVEADRAREGVDLTYDSPPPPPVPDGYEGEWGNRPVAAAVDPPASRPAARPATRPAAEPPPSPAPSTLPTPNPAGPLPPDAGGPPPGSVTIDPRDGWSAVAWASDLNTRATRIDQAGEHPAFVVDEPGKRGVWLKEIGPPVDPARHPIIVLRYRATNVAPVRYAVWLDDGTGPNNGKGVWAVDCAELVADGQVREVRRDLSKPGRPGLPTTGRFDSVAIGVSAVPGAKASLEVIDLGSSRQGRQGRRPRRLPATTTPATTTPATTTTAPNPAEPPALLKGRVVLRDRPDVGVAEATVRGVSPGGDFLRGTSGPDGTFTATHRPAAEILFHAATADRRCRAAAGQGRRGGGRG
jgi:hypothetical protein